MGEEGVKAGISSADVAALIATHAAVTITHGAGDAIADQADIATHAAVAVTHGATDAIADQADIATHAALADVHHSEVHGASEHNDVTRELFVAAAGAGVDAGTAHSGSGTYGVVKGAANSWEPMVGFTFKVPGDFVSFVSVKGVWMCAASSGNMYWRITARYAAAGEVNNVHYETPGLGVTATGGNLIVNCQEGANALTLVSLAKGDFVGVYFERKGDDALDTLNSIVYLLGLLFTYVAEQ